MAQKTSLVVLNDKQDEHLPRGRAEVAKALDQLAA